MAPGAWWVNGAAGGPGFEVAEKLEQVALNSGGFGKIGAKRRKRDADASGCATGGLAAMAHRLTGR